MKKLQITDFRVQQGIELYKTGKPIKAILKELKMDGSAFTRLLSEAGVERRTHSEAVRSGKLSATVNDRAFDVLTPEALYWVGFLYADGHIEKDRPRINLTLSEVDRGHLEKYSKFLGEGLTIRYYEDKTPDKDGYIGAPVCRVGLSSPKIHKRLQELGFTHRKTYTKEGINPILANSVDFWRGVVDGDGWVCTKVWTVGLCGAKVTIEYFIQFLMDRGLESKTTVNTSKRSEHLFKYELHHHKAVQVLNILYKNAPVYLERKYQKYLEIMSQQK